jgi:thioredoxin-related protein
MKKLTLILTLSLLGSTVMYAQKDKKQPAKQSIAIGTVLPAAGASLPATDGKQYKLADQITGKGLIVMFSCNTCPYVIKAQERTREVIDLAKEHGLGIVIVNSNVAQRDDADSHEAMAAYGAAQHPDAPYLIDDGPLVSAFGATRTPEVFLFDGKSQKLVYKGAMEDNPANPAASEELFLHDAVHNMLSGKKIDPNTTKSVGCTIKL